MKALAILAVVSVVGVATAGCSQLFGIQSTTARSINLDGSNQGLSSQALIMPGDKRAIIIRRGPGNFPVSCAEPAPDISLSTLSELAAKLAASADTAGGLASPDLSADLSSKLATTAAELGGRNSTVLIARDFLFRLCELSANYKPDSAEYKAVAAEYIQVLSVIKDLATAAKSEAAAKEKAASAEEAQAQAALIKAQVDAQLYIGELQAKIDVIVAKVTKSNQIVLDELQKLVSKIPADVLNDAGRRRILTAPDTKGLREILSSMGDQVVSPMWLAAKS